MAIGLELYTNYCTSGLSFVDGLMPTWMHPLDSWLSNRAPSRHLKKLDDIVSDAAKGSTRTNLTKLERWSINSIESIQCNIQRLVELLSPYIFTYWEWIESLHAIRDLILKMEYWSQYTFWHTTAVWFHFWHETFFPSVFFVSFLRTNGWRQIDQMSNWLQFHGCSSLVPENSTWLIDWLSRLMVP